MESFLEINITLFSENKTASCKKKEIFHGKELLYSGKKTLHLPQK